MFLKVQSWAIESHPKKQEILWNQIEEIEKKINAINRELSNKEDSILNLTDFLKYAIDLVYNPLEIWKKVELGDKQRFQNLLFPKGILFDKENKHIEPLIVNQFFVINPNLSVNYENKKRGLFYENTEKSPYVLGSGVLRHITGFRYVLFMELVTGLSSLLFAKQETVSNNKRTIIVCFISYNFLFIFYLFITIRNL